MYRNILTFLFGFTSPLLAQADKKPAIAEVAEAPATEHIRVERSENKVKLQTAVTRLNRGPINVDLIGAVHIADEAYYKKLNTLFTEYDVLLFEMIGGENLGNGRAIPKGDEAGKGSLNMLNTAYEKMQSMLDLKGQKDLIDYSPENFVHADLTIAEFHKLQSERKESIFGFMMKQAFEPQTGNQPSTAGLLLALISRDSDRLKLQFVDSLGEGDNRIGSIAGENVIITDRNLKCLAVIQDQIKAGKKKIGIFYGAAHFPDMEKRLKEMGFKQEKQDWLDAWVIEK